MRMIYTCQIPTESLWTSFERVVITCVICVSLIAVDCELGAAQSDVPSREIIEPRLLVFRDPELIAPESIRRLPPSYLELWLTALSGPEQELKRDVAMDINRAHRDGYLDCSAAVDALIEVLKDDTLERSVRVEVARTLITLNDRKCSATLRERLLEGSGTQFELLVEPVLAQWLDLSMQTIWQQRVIDSDAPRYRRLLALHALAVISPHVVYDAGFLDSLQNLVSTSRDVAIVLQASKTLGEIKRSGLESLADDFMTSTGAVSQVKSLATAYLLLHHTSETSRDLLMQIIRQGLIDPHNAPAVRVAWRRLLERDTTELVELSQQGIQHSDPEIRRVAVDTILQFKSGDGIKLLGQTLDDRHPEIRRAARQAMLQLSADASLDEAVRLASMEVVNGSSWKGQEQAVILLALLNESDLSDRLLELLHSPRAEVAIAAAWGLRRLNVAEASAPMLKFVETLDQQAIEEETLRPHQITVLAHIFEAFGKADYQPAVPLLRRWVPKSAPRVNMNEARDSAFFALGLIFEDSHDAALAAALKARFLDYRSPEPETFDLRYAAAIALGRIGVREVAAVLRPSALEGRKQIDLAAAWAINRLTGETIPPQKPITAQGSHWKLLPIGSRLKGKVPAESAR